MSQHALAEPGTLRRAYGFSIERNAVHGPDGTETAEWEVGYFFEQPIDKPIPRAC